MTDVRTERLREEVAAGSALLGSLRSASGPPDPRRVLAVVTAAPTSERYLACTLSLLLRQAEVAGLHADVVLGLNNGYRCDDVVAEVAARTGVPVTTVTPTPRPSPRHAGTFSAPRRAVEGAPDGHRLIVVAQPASPWSAAKTRILHDIVSGLLLPGMAEGWTAPRWTLLLDAESMFAVRDDPTAAAEIASARALLAAGVPVPVAFRALLADGVVPGADGFDARSAALARLLEVADRDALDLVGAATRFSTFRPRGSLGDVPVWLPALQAPIAPPYQVYAVGCGLLAGCGCLSGAGTLARTDVLVAYLATVLDRHADVYGEDAIMTVLAGAAGHPFRLERSVQVTNRCPAWDETDDDGRPSWLRQFTLWYSGFAAVEARYGRTAAREVLGPNAADAQAVGVVLAARAAARAGDPAAGQTVLARLVESDHWLRQVHDVTELARAR
jgi:hypothetical protein